MNALLYNDSPYRIYFIYFIPYLFATRPPGAPARVAGARSYEHNFGVPHCTIRKGTLFSRFIEIYSVYAMLWNCQINYSFQYLLRTGNLWVASDSHLYKAGFQKHLFHAKNIYSYLIFSSYKTY